MRDRLAKASACVLAGMALVVVLVPPATAVAQREASTLAELARRPEARPGTELIVTFALTEGGEPEQFVAELVSMDAAGVRVKLDLGFAARRTDLSYEVIGRGDSPVFAELPHTIVEIPAQRVVRIAAIDSLGNGAAIGAGVGAVPAALSAFAACSYGGDCGEVALIAVGVSLAAGTALGVVVDAGRKKEGRILYAAPGSTPTTRYTLAPIVSRDRQGAMFVIRW